MRKTIAVDMDGVLADTVEQYQRLNERNFGCRKAAPDIHGIPELDAFERVGEYLRTPGFFRTMPLMPDAQPVLAQLHARHDVFIVSAAMEFPLSLAEKQAWLGEHFPFIGWQQIVFCGAKRIIRADAMIDDYLKNLDYFTGKGYLFTAPHNATIGTMKHERVNSWQEVALRLL
jgi:5'-nucleotidase